MSKRSSTAFLLALAAGCDRDAAAPAAGREKTTEPPAALAGVWPNKFECTSIATPAALAAVLGGEPRPLDNPVSTPKGVAAPCKYEIVREGAAEQWQFDFDCRDTMKRTADRLFEDYRRENVEAIQRWNERADAGVPRPSDAGVADVRPGDPVEVAVGAKGLDHRGLALIFIDDDAPCYVRVAGGDATRRLALAKLIAKNLTFDNAPMEPRARK